MKQDKLISGEWSGFYFEPHRSPRSWMHLYMEFQNGEIRGEGTDYIGPWHAAGRYALDTLDCTWVKQYVGKHRIQYHGKVSDGEIRGAWSISFHTGEFHIWPAVNTRTTEFYLDADRNDTD